MRRKNCERIGQFFLRSFFEFKIVFRVVDYDGLGLPCGTRRPHVVRFFFTPRGNITETYSG